MVELSPREREILTFEREWWRYAEAKETAIRGPVRAHAGGLLPRAERDDRPARRAGATTRCWSGGCAGSGSPAAERRPASAASGPRPEPALTMDGWDSPFGAFVRHRALEPFPERRFLV